MVGSFYFLLHSWLAGIAGRNKLLINMKGHLQRCAFCFAFIWFRVQGSRFMVEEAASPLFLLGRCLEVAFKSPVTSHSYDTREGIVSHVCCQILRRSPHLFWLGFSHMGRFRPLRMTICEGRRALIGLGVWMGNSYFPLLHFYEPARV